MSAATVERQNLWGLSRRFPLMDGFRAVCEEHPNDEPYIPAWQGDIHMIEGAPGAWIMAALDAAEHNAEEHRPLKRESGR